MNLGHFFKNDVLLKTVYISFYTMLRIQWSKTGPTVPFKPEYKRLHHFVIVLFYLPHVHTIFT